ncbi:hypothetical protein GCM10010328_27810 [Streptomyces rubiginosohelvolus]|uniref:Secreted protein n=1 Tax=Streptomyces rubiginosohelvolus TaxID=67362 RepID=A0ABQ3BMC5_9ACTN|nr:hypothetical protein GCM10010328_27810 [Streptomyces pluricolorescens]
MVWVAVVVIGRSGCAVGRSLLITWGRIRSWRTVDAPLSHAQQVAARTRWAAKLITAQTAIRASHRRWTVTVGWSRISVPFISGGGAEARTGTATPGGPGASAG